MKKKIFILAIIFSLVMLVNVVKGESNENETFSDINNRFEVRQSIMQLLDGLAEERFNQVLEDKFRFITEPRDETDFYNINWDTVEIIDNE
jgi:hypothetical protein